MEEYIKLLDLPDEFGQADLKKAYRKKVLQYHPDKASNEAERVGYEALMKKLNEAYEYLKDYLEHHNGKYSKADENTNNYSDYSTYDTDNSAQEDYQDESSQNENEQYTNEENFYNKEIYRRAIGATIGVIIGLILTPFWLKLYDIAHPNSSQTYTQESKQETKQEIPTQNTTQNNTINQQSNSQENNKDIYKDVSKSEMEEYMRELQRRIEMNWSLPKDIEESNSDNTKVVTRFKIAKDGSLLGVPVIEKSSGIESVDSSCIDAIKLAAPFRLLPQGFTGEYIEISFTFEALRKPH